MQRDTKLTSQLQSWQQKHVSLQILISMRNYSKLKPSSAVSFPFFAFLLPRDQTVWHSKNSGKLEEMLIGLLAGGRGNVMTE